MSQLGVDLDRHTLASGTTIIRVNEPRGFFLATVGIDWTIRWHNGKLAGAQGGLASGLGHSGPNGHTTKFQRLETG